MNTSPSDIRECLDVRAKVAVVSGDHKQILGAGNHEKPGKMNGTHLGECGINGSLILGEIFDYGPDSCRAG